MKSKMRSPLVRAIREDWKKVLNEIWYCKISPSGFFKGMEIVMFPNNDFTFKDVEPDFDFETFELFLKEHLKTKPEQICFPKTCWKIKGKPQPIWMAKWLKSRPIKIRTDTKIGGGSEPLPKRLLRNHGSN